MTEPEVLERLVDIISKRTGIPKEEFTMQTVLPDIIGQDNTYLLVHLCMVRFGKTIVIDVRYATIGDFVRQLVA